MHVLYLTSCLSIGGAQKIIVGLAEQAVECGHKATILTICPGNSYRDRLQEHGIDYSTLGYDGGFSPTSLFPVARLRSGMLQTVREIGPDLIHEQLFIPKILSFGMKGIASVPVVHTQQDTSPWWQGRGTSAKLKTLVERLFSRRTAYINVAVSRSVLEKMVERGLVREGEGVVINNFTDLVGQRVGVSSRERTAGQAARILMVSRLQWRKKGLDVAIDVLNTLRSGGVDVELVVVGDGPDRERMVDYAESKGVLDAVDFRGFEKEVRSHYLQADVLLIPSRWEGLSVTALESAAMGLPIVGTQIGGIKEIVVDDKTGYTCPPEDVTCLAKRIRVLLENEERRAEFSRKSIERAKRKYSPRASFKTYEELYRCCLPSG